METWSKICCAIDLGARSDRIVRDAASLARRLDAKLILLHVDEQAQEGSALYAQPEVRDALRRDRQYALEERRRAAADLRGDEVEAFLLPDHDVVDRVIGFARDAGCDLIVAGARAEPHRSPFESVAEKIVKRAPCSVLVVRTGGRSR